MMIGLVANQNQFESYHPQEVACRERLDDEVRFDEVGVPPALMEYQQESQQTINFLKSNEHKFRKRWMGFRPANETNFKHSVSVLGFVGISDPRVVRPWR